MADPYRYFRIEAGEILEQLQKGLLDLEKDGALPDVVPRLLRLAHTIKGAARVVRQGKIADLAHALEDALVPFRDLSLPVDAKTVEKALGFTDAIRQEVVAIAEPAPAPHGAASTIEAPESPSKPESTDEPLRALRADVRDVDALMTGIVEANFQIGALKHLTKTMERTRGLSEVLSDQLAPWRATDGRSLVRAGALSAELATLLSGLERDLATGIEQATRELGQVRDATERLRLVPAELLFGTLERTARDVAHSLGKRVVFQARDGDVRLDVELLGAVQRALVQAVRNAVAHGIESPSERTASGKSTQGLVSIEVVRRGKHVNFICRDDGRGIDREAVERTARTRGLLTSSHQPTATELATLLLKGGISTSRSVTGVSGRGVGLDVVREVTEQHHGEVTLQTEAGKGTTLQLSLPISVSALEVLVVEAGNHVAAVPLDAVHRTFRLPLAELAHTAHGESVVVDGKVLPFAALTRLLEPNQSDQDTEAVWSAVLLESGGSFAVLGVNRLLGTESVVARSLPSEIQADDTVAGVSLDADGNPRLLLDIEGLLAAVSRAGAAPRAAETPRTAVLVIDDSLTTRMLEQSILESAGYEVDTATSGEEALIQAGRRRYALFLVDVEMPGMDGFTFIETTRADPNLRDVPAILVTSRASPEDLERGRSAGASAHIVKNEFDQNDLLTRIRRLIG